MTTNNHVLLYGLANDFGLVVRWPTGILYENQTGGYACMHDTMEGFFLPLGREPEALIDFFLKGHWQGDCTDGIDEATADFIDGLFADPGSASLRVNRQRLSESREAWVHMTVGGGLWLFKTLPDGVFDAVLTWGTATRLRQLQAMNPTLVAVRPGARAGWSGGATFGRAASVNAQ